jgi:hypothetical protein
MTQDRTLKSAFNLKDMFSPMSFLERLMRGSKQIRFTAEDNKFSPMSFLERLIRGSEQICFNAEDNKTPFMILPLELK